MDKFQKIFKKKKNIIIGVIHFPALLGYPNFPGFEIAIKRALKDLKAFEKGGVDGIFIENNYDVPHNTFVDQEIVASLTYLGEKVKNATKLPVGISVLWNDYKTALSISKILNLDFIRIPVFVDKVKTKDCGLIDPVAKDAIKYRKKIKAENIAIFADIHVKHCEIISRYSIAKSAKLAIENQADALIITGNWTGQMPDMKELRIVRLSVKNFPILIGSGTDKNNINDIFKYANGAIVSTSLKRGVGKPKERNVKKFDQEIDIKKVRKLIKKIK